MPHRWFLLISLCLLAPYPVPAQWTPAAPVFPGANNETHPAFVRRLRFPWGGSASTERLVFTQSTVQGSRIILAHTKSGLISWDDSLEDITGDSVLNDFATAATAAYGWGHDSTLMVLWEAGRDSGTIWYRYFADTAWREPARLTNGNALERRPFITPMDSGYAAVWESEGRIAFATYRNEAWTNAEFASPAGDTSNRNPQVLVIQNYQGDRFPIVMWEQTKADGITRAVVYSMRTRAGWMPLDTIGWSGDNLRPRFSPTAGSFNGPFELSYESDRSGKWDIYTSVAYSSDSNGVTWSTRNYPETGNLNLASDNRDATVYFWPIITSQYESPAFYPDIAGVWVAGDGAGDSIALATYSLLQFETVAQESDNRNPVLSSGVWLNGSLRLYALWENNATGSWKLVESHIDLNMGAVEDEPGVARGFKLQQNYPNPFNPTTTIQFSISVGTYCNTSIQLFDILGREVATLVNEVKQPGRYTVTWDASKLASGMYLVRMTAVPVGRQAGKFTATRKILLLR